MTAGKLVENLLQAGRRLQWRIICGLLIVGGLGVSIYYLLAK